MLNYGMRCSSSLTYVIFLYIYFNDMNPIQSYAPNKLQPSNDQHKSYKLQRKINTNIDCFEGHS